MRGKFFEPPLLLDYKKPHTKLKYCGVGRKNKFKFDFLIKKHSYVLVSRAFGKVSLKELELIRKFSFKQIKKFERRANFIIRCYPSMPLVSKPVLVRMGSGKGSRIKKWVCFVKPGLILFEIENASPKFSKYLLNNIIRKFSISLNIFYKNEIS